MSTILSHGTSIYYERMGTGPRVIVFAHGMGGNGAIWYQQLAEFSQDFTVITFDHRYFARSPCGEEDFKPALFPADVINIMDAEAIPSASFVCQSMGGWTGSQMALQHPDRVEALVMSHTPGIFTVSGTDYDPRKTSTMVSGPTNEFSSGALADDFPVKNRAAALLYEEISNFNKIDPALIPRAINAARLSVDVDSLTDYDIPTLFISADKDELFPASYLEAIAKVLPGADFINLGDAGHSSYFELPVQFNQAVREFLSR